MRKTRTHTSFSSSFSVLADQEIVKQSHISHLISISDVDEIMPVYSTESNTFDLNQNF